jgi:hypothetical protein
MTSDDLLAQLAAHGIEAVTREHPPVHTVEESRQWRGDIPGIHTKNLFLRDSKKTFFLVVADEAATVNLKDLRHKIGAKGNLSFGAQMRYSRSWASRQGRSRCWRWSTTPSITSPWSSISPCSPPTSSIAIRSLTHARHRCRMKRSGDSSR